MVHQPKMQEILESFAIVGAASTSAAALVGDPSPRAAVSSTVSTAVKSSDTYKGKGKSNTTAVSGRPSIIIYMDCDDESLSDYQCILRKQIELFEATAEDVQWNAQGRNKAVRAFSYLVKHYMVHDYLTLVFLNADCFGSSWSPVSPLLQTSNMESGERCSVLFCYSGRAVSSSAEHGQKSSLSSLSTHPNRHQEKIVEFERLQTKGRRRKEVLGRRCESVGRYANSCRSLFSTRSLSTNLMKTAGVTLKPC
jgi:hypothetical protein